MEVWFLWRKRSEISIVVIISQSERGREIDEENRKKGEERERNVDPKAEWRLCTLQILKKCAGIVRTHGIDEEDRPSGENDNRNG
jgi:hypothetical protein